MLGDGHKSSPAYRFALRQTIKFLALILMGCCVASCAYNYNIKVNGYTDPNAPSQLRPGAAFFVMGNKEAKNPLLETEIKEKINKLLGQHGYVVTTFAKADYYLFFSYGMKEPRSVTVVTPDYYGGFGWGAGCGWGGPAFYFTVPPWGAYPSYATTLYDRWLLINVVDGPAYRTRQESRPVWVGEARSTGASSDLRTVLNYLLVADFKEFGKNTGQAVTVELGEKDPEVAALTRK